MFDEIVLKTNLGCRISPGQMAVGCFSFERQVGSAAVVAISQTLDKLVVHNCENCSAENQAQSLEQLDFESLDDGQFNGATKEGSLLPIKMGANGSQLLDNSSSISTSSSRNATVANAYYIGVKDVIKTVAIKQVKATFAPLERSSLNNSLVLGSRMKATDEGQIHQRNNNKDLLLVGCFTRLVIYDTSSRSSLFTVNTPTPVNAITTTSTRGSSSSCGGHSNQSTNEDCLFACGGPQRLYLLKLDTNLEGDVSAEITSERSIEGTVNCMAWGRLDGMSLVLFGSLEHQISVFQLDTFDQNIQACRLNLAENAIVNCLLPINTVDGCVYDKQLNQRQTAEEVKQRRPLLQSNPQADATNLTDKNLPSVINTGDTLSSPGSTTSGQFEQMNYFAFGLESGLIGVYRLLNPSGLLLNPIKTSGGGGGASAKLTSERVWRYRCKHVPMSMLLCDTNGDGLDELVIGFKNGRIEVRAPFTGQLLSVTRAFKRDHPLAGLAMLDHNDHYDMIDQEASRRLVACSTNGSLIAFKAPPLLPGTTRRPLQGFKASKPSSGDLLSPLSESNSTWLYSSLQLANQQQQQQQQQQVASSNFKTIEEELQTNVFMASQASKQVRDGASSPLTDDLHIESKSDETKPTRCDSVQNLDLLQRVNALYGQQLDLQRRACRIYQSHIQQQQLQQQPVGSQVNVAHRWDFNLNAVCLELTIVISTTNVEEVRLVELEDESRKFLTNGYLLVNGLDNAQALNNKNHNNRSNQHVRIKAVPSREGGKSHILIVPMRPTKTFKSDAQSWILVKVYCSKTSRLARKFNGAEEKPANSEQVIQQAARVCCKLIEVPKFSMFVLASTLRSDTNLQQQQQQSVATTATDAPVQVPRANISLAFRLRERSKARQTIRWLNESFLCLQFARLISDSDLPEGSPLLVMLDELAGRQSGSGGGANPLPPPDTLMMDEFEEEIGGKAADSASDSAAAAATSGTLKFELQLVDIRDLLAPSNTAGNSSSSALLLESKCLDKAADHSAMNNFVGKCKSLLSTKQQQQQQQQKPAMATTANSYTLRIAYSNGWLTFDSANSDLVVDLVQSLVIDRLQLKLTADKLQEGEVVANLQAILCELESASDSLRQLEESEKRIQSELYESVDYTKNLMQQFAIANELNEFTLAKELLNELYIMLCGAQNAARAHYLNNRRAELVRNVNELKGKLSFLSGDCDFIKQTGE